LEWEENEDTYDEETDRLHIILRIITIAVGMKLATDYLG
jgi:hypothetical protein